MPFYFVRIRYAPSRGIKLLLREVDLFKHFYDMSEEDIRKIRDAQKKDSAFELYGERIAPNRIKAINVYRTEKSVKELSACYDGQTELVRKNILDGKIGENVTGLFFPPSPLHEDKPLTINDLSVSAQFLGLDNNWFTATCALQLQEVATILIAKRRNIKLDKLSVEKSLNKRIELLSFNDQYEAFSKQMKGFSDVEMPLLPKDLRQMRRRVLHQGYNPTQEEADSIVGFTIGLLKRLDSLCSD